MGARESAMIPENNKVYFPTYFTSEPSARIPQNEVKQIRTYGCKCREISVFYLKALGNVFVYSRTVTCVK